MKRKPVSSQGGPDYGLQKTGSILRVYEYVADDGTVYWSLHQNAMLVSTPTRLLMQDRKGMVLGQFMQRLRVQIMQQKNETQDLEEEG